MDKPQAVAKHTPGPWKCVEVEFGDYQTGEVAFVVSSESAQMVGSIANTRLIAVAPLMFDALETADRILAGEMAADILVVKDNIQTAETLGSVIRAALAKARGAE